MFEDYNFDNFVNSNNTKVYGIKDDDTFELTLLCNDDEYYLKHKFNVYDYIIVKNFVFIVYKDTCYSFETGEPITATCCTRLPYYYFHNNGKYKDVEIPSNMNLKDAVLPTDLIPANETYYKLIKFLVKHKKRPIHGDVTYYSLPMAIITPMSSDIYNITHLTLHEKDAIVNPGSVIRDLLDGIELSIIIGDKRIEQVFNYDSPYRIKFLGKEYNMSKLACKILKDTFDLEQKLKIM